MMQCQAAAHPVSDAEAAEKGGGKGALELEENTRNRAFSVSRLAALPLRGCCTGSVFA